jgi:peroxiredoxin
MKTLKEQTQAQVAKTKQVKPEYIKELDDVMESARKFKQGADAIKVGEIAPDFTLPDANKKMLTLSELLKSGPVVISFYRGNWCPYCSLELKALQARLADIKALGAELVTISPQMPDESLSKEDIEALNFFVLSDQDAEVASQYGVAWNVPEFILQHMKRDRDLDLADINNGNRNILPIPATFVIDKNGVVVWQYTDIDFRTRAEPEDIISALKKL